MRELVDAIVHHLQENWIRFLTGAAFMVVGWFLGKRRARAEWQKKQFWDRINFSLNSIDESGLKIRTLIEKSCGDVFLNSVAANTIRTAAQQTTEKNPVLPLPKDEYWFYLNAVLNEVSEKFSTGLIRRDLGQEVTSTTYLICLTCEVAGAIRTHKVRAMLIRKDALETLPAKQPNLESHNHSTRWNTLQLLSREWKENPHKFIEMEICV